MKSINDVHTYSNELNHLFFRMHGKSHAIPKNQFYVIHVKVTRILLISQFLINTLNIVKGLGIRESYSKIASLYCLPTRRRCAHWIMISR